MTIPVSTGNIGDRCASLKKSVAMDLIRIFDLDYIVKESQLPFIVGYVLMTAASTQQPGKLLTARLPGQQVTDKVLEDATDVVKSMLDSGAEALVVDHILPKALGVQIVSEFEDSE
jgi:hypothetical protein